jgi:hypothetical protein
MSVRDPQEFRRRLRELNEALEGSSSNDIDAAPNVKAEVARLVELLADRDLLQKCGYVTLEQACGRICDVFEEGALARVKEFSHCGQSHQYHALQVRVVCPVCRQYRTKTRRFFAHDEFEDVAWSALTWLGIDRTTIPGWNLDSDDSTGHDKGNGGR